MVGISVVWGKRIGNARTVRRTDSGVVYEFEHYDDAAVEEMGSLSVDCPDFAAAIKELNGIITARSRKACLVKFTIVEPGRIVTSDGWTHSGSAAGCLSQL